MKLLEFSGWRVVAKTQSARLLINPNDRACSDGDVIVTTPMGLLEGGRHMARTRGPWAMTGAQWRGGGMCGTALRPGVIARCEGWEFAWHAGQPGLLVGRSPTASFMYVDGTPHRGGAVAREAVDCVLIPGDTGKWLSVALGRSHGFDRAEHESRLEGIARILDAARSPWVLGEPQEGLPPRLAHVAADVSPERYFLDVQAFLHGTMAENLPSRRHDQSVGCMPFEPELAGDSHPATAEPCVDQTDAAAATLRSLVVEGELASMAACWNACLQVTLVHERGERKVWRDFSASGEVRSGEGPNERANLFVRCTPRAVLDLRMGCRGILAVMRDGSLSCWTKLWRIDELGRFRSPEAENDIPANDTHDRLEPAHLLWHLLASLGASVEPA
jgi:hypothetical protein